MESLKYLKNSLSIKTIANIYENCEAEYKGVLKISTRWVLGTLV